MFLYVFFFFFFFNFLSGYFAYIDPSSPRQSGDIAAMYNPDFVATPKGQCLRFWYHMHSAGVGSLSVRKYDLTNQILGDEIWRKSGDQGDMWRYVTVTLQDQNTPWAVSILRSIDLMICWHGETWWQLPL